MAFTKAEKMEAAASIYELMLAGESDDRIMSAMGMSAELFQEAKRFMLESKASEARSKSREVVYVEYVLEQRGNVRQIDDLLNVMSGPDGKKHYNAFVGALRLRSDIADRILERGYELGIVRKTPEQHEVIGGIAVAGMTSEDLLKAIKEAVSLTTSVPFADKSILELDAGPLHRGEGVIDALVEDGEDDEALLASVPAPPAAKSALPPPTSRSKPAIVPPLAKPVPKPAVKSAPHKR